MNVKRASIFAGSVAALAFAGAASAGYGGMAWSEVDNGGLEPLEGGQTFRIYALVSEGAQLNAVAGNEATTLSLTSNGYFYQDALGGPTSQSINSGFFPLAPTLEFDSYVTIGALYQNGDPFDSNGLNNIGVDWGPFEAGGDLETVNGTWFTTPDMEQGDALLHTDLYDGEGYSIGSQWGVLIAQVTVIGANGARGAGTFSALMQGKDVNGDTWQGSAVNFTYGTYVPAPGALALLGLAGLAGRRRRR